MRIDELPHSDRIEDRRGAGSGGLRGGRGGLGIGAVVVLGLIGWALGIDPRLLIQGAETITGSDPVQQQTNVGSSGAPSDATGNFISAVLGSTEVQWTAIFF